MAAASDYLETALLNHVFRNTAYTSPTDVYVALFTNDPGEGDTGTEVTGGSYARQEATFSAPSSGSISNSSDITFADMPSTTVTHFAIYDDVSAGNMLAYGELNSPSTFNAGDDAEFASGTLTLSLA